MDLGFAPEMNSILHLRIPTQNSIHPENKTWILWNLGILEHLKICCFEVLALNFPDPNPFIGLSRHALDKALMTLFKASQAHHVLSCQLLVVPVLLFLID
jgi:hypothetical protein